VRSVGAGMELGAVEADMVEDCFFFFLKSKKKVGGREGLELG
jgi:hypothetical protein